MTKVTFHFPNLVGLSGYNTDDLLVWIPYTAQFHDKFYLGLITCYQI